MTSQQPLISRVASDVLTGYYKRKRLTQEELAERSGIALPTLQKKLKANAPITATDLVVLSQAIGVDPAEVMTEIVKEASVSEAPVSLSERRAAKTPADMSDTEREGLPHAAFDDDPEIGHDEQ